MTRRQLVTTTARHKQAVGRFGEEVAARHLEMSGMEVLDRNWRTTGGELDLVLRDGRTLVICEVKTRSSADYGLPSDAIRPEKVRRLRRLAVQWAREHDVYLADIRIDVVSIVLSPRGAAQVEHIEGVL